MVKVHNDILMNQDTNRGMVAFCTIEYLFMIQRLDNRKRYQSYRSGKVYVLFSGRSQAAHIWKHMISFLCSRLYSLLQYSNYNWETMNYILVHSSMITMVDCANTTLYGLPPHKWKNRLQRIGNNDAIIVKLCEESHFSSFCYNLHWLAIKEGIGFHILHLTFKPGRMLLNGLLQLVVWVP